MFAGRFDKIILGIDPGTVVMGYGVIGISGKKAVLISMGYLSLNKWENHYFRLKKIYERTHELIREYSPSDLSIEAPFYGNNVQSMLKLGRAQGVAIVACLEHEIPIKEYSPSEIKQAITGSGSASKEQVAHLLQSIFKIPNENMLPHLDATDGLAAAYCHFLSLSNPRPIRKNTKSWAAYVKQNPNKISKLK